MGVHDHVDRGSSQLTMKKRLDHPYTNWLGTRTTTLMNPWKDENNEPQANKQCTCRLTRLKGEVEVSHQSFYCIETLGPQQMVSEHKKKKKVLAM